MRGLDVPLGSFVPYGRFGRLFPNIRPAADSKELAEILGSPTGPMVGDSGWNFRIPAGYTYLGQFIDHDLTFDPTSSLERKNDPRAIQNFRTAAFDLDSVYGSGPQAQPYLYDPQSLSKFRLGNPERTDLRRIDGVALIGDPRNDLNFFVSQLHTAFLNFHNYIVDKLATDFETARRLVRWHYQWIVRHDYLPRIVDEEVIEQCQTNGLRFFHWVGQHPFIPVEFSVAAFRFGHCQIRSQYDIGTAPRLRSVRLENLFGPNVFRNLQNPVDWHLFFPFHGAKYQLSRPLGFRLVPALMKLPKDALGPHPVESMMTGAQDRLFGIRPQWLSPHESAADVDLSLGDEPVTSLAFLDIRRGQSFSLPPGTSVAALMERSADHVLQPPEVWAQINEALAREKRGPIPLDTDIPLWLYILMEAQKRNLRSNGAFGNGERLGPVGSRIVTEVFLGLLESDSESYLSQEPSWKPERGRVADRFDMVDLLELAEQGRRLAFQSNKHTAI